jgi:molecular chaperone HscA
MLLDAIEHAEDDITVRQLREQRVEATRLLKDAHKQLQDNGDLLSEEELLGVRQACAAVESAASGKDYVAIKDAIAALDVVSRPFAERIMDRTMGKALSGHRVEEF